MEKWKPLIYNTVDYGVFYEVSNLGRVRNAKTKRVVKLNSSQTGYLCYVGSLGSRSKSKSFRINRAVMCSFEPAADTTKDVNHIDGDKHNNTISNLEWCSASENIRHAYQNKLMSRRTGSTNSAAKLSNEAIKKIRELYIRGNKEFGCRALGKKYNVAHTTISDIVNNISWI